MEKVVKDRACVDLLQSGGFQTHRGEVAGGFDFHVFDMEPGSGTTGFILCLLTSTI